MNYRPPVPGGRLAALLAVAISTVLSAGAVARAATCGTATVAGAGCTAAATVTLTAGALTLTSPAALAWGSMATGLDQQLVDTTPAQQALSVTDATGTGAGWHITVSATQFTSGTGTLANTGTFALTGSTSPPLAAATPTAACSTGSTCMLPLPTDTTIYPVAITTAASSPAPFTIYDTGQGTGIGTIGIGSVGWWVGIPGNTLAGTYTSTVTLEILSGP